MSISHKWSRLAVAVALTASVSALGVTAASAGVKPRGTGECNTLTAAQPVIDASTHTNPVVGTNYGTGTGHGTFLGAYGSNYGDFDLAYTRSGATGSINVYFEYWALNSDGSCEEYSGGGTTVGGTQTVFYEFKNLPAWTGSAVVGMNSSEGWVLIQFN